MKDMMKMRLSAVARRSWAASAVLIGAALISICKATDGNATMVSPVEKIAGTPHFFQCDPRGGFPEEGRNYCCPTAVSDSLVYLASHGFPRLLNGAFASPDDAQIAMIKRLASPQFMGTDPSSGTNGSRACTGIRRYVEAAGYVCQTLEFTGWHLQPKAPDLYWTAPTSLSLSWIKRTTIDPHGAVWVNIGWYVHGTGPDEWKRVSGHWVAVVGCVTDGTDHDPDVLLIDNPAVRSFGRSFGNPQRDHRRGSQGAEAPTLDEVAAAVMMTARMKSGRLVGSDPGLPRDAAGMYQVWGRGVQMPAKFDAAFLDGAIVLVIGN